VTLLWPPRADDEDWDVVGKKGKRKRKKKPGQWEAQIDSMRAHVSTQVCGPLQRPPRRRNL
jgi:hypothetical protein